MQKKILIVEDDPVIQQLIEWRLISLGYSVCGKATNAQEALSKVLQNEPDVVLMDIHLDGGMDGIDAAAAIKRMNRLPVIFLTAETSKEDLLRAKAVPPDGFIVKPFNDMDLRVALTLAIEDPGQKSVVPLSAETGTVPVQALEDPSLTLPDVLFNT